MKKNRFLIYSFVFVITLLLQYIIIIVDPFHLGIYTPASAVPVITSGIHRNDFHGIALPYVSATVTDIADFVPVPSKYTRSEALEKIREFIPEYPEMEEICNNPDIYPDSVLEALANNPEMLDYAFGYVSEKHQIVQGVFTQDELEQEYPLLLQWDYRWGYMPYGNNGTIGTAGCGPTALSMAILYLTDETDITPDVIAQYSLENNYYVEGYGTSWGLLDTYPTLHGLSVDLIYLHEPYLTAELDKGNILICSVKEGNFTYGGHFIVIYGYDETGFKVNDPKCAYRSQFTWTYDQIKEDIRRTWSIGKE